MPKKWKIENDQFLIAYEGMGANFIANHDLGFQSKDAGVNRIKKLKETGIYDKIKAYQDAKQAMHDAWIMEFGPEWAREIVYGRMNEDDMPWSQKEIDKSEMGLSGAVQ